MVKLVDTRTMTLTEMAAVLDSIDLDTYAVYHLGKHAHDDNKQTKFLDAKLDWISKRDDYLTLNIMRCDDKVYYYIVRRKQKQGEIIAKHIRIGDVPTQTRRYFGAYEPTIKVPYVRG